MTQPHEEWPNLPTGTQEHEYVGDDTRPMSLDEINAELGIDNATQPQPVTIRGGHPIEHDEHGNSTEQPLQAEAGDPASDADSTATSRRERRAQKRTSGKKKALVSSGIAGATLVAALAASRLLGAGGETEPQEPVQGGETEEVIPGEAGENPDAPIVIDDPKPTEEPQTSDVEANLPEATGKIDGMWQEEDMMEFFKPMEDATPEEFFENYYGGERFQYALWKASQYADENAPDGRLELPTISTPSYEGLITIPNKELLDAYNDMIHRILPIIHANAGVDEAKKFLYGITADTPIENPFEGELYDESRQKWLDVIAAYPDKPVDHGPYVEPTEMNDMGAAWSSYIRQVHAKEGDTAGLTIMFHIEEHSAQGVHILSERPYDHDADAAIVPQIIWANEQILDQ